MQPNGWVYRSSDILYAFILHAYSCSSSTLHQRQRTKPKLTPILPILLPILRSGSTMQQVPRPDQEHIYGGGGMHVELCSEDAQRQQWDHECDGPCCRSPKPRKEPTMPLLLQLHPQLKRSLPFIFYTHSFLCALCQSICSSVTSGGSHFAPRIIACYK